MINRLGGSKLQKRDLFLFNDIIIITKATSKGLYKWKGQLDLKAATVENVTNMDGTSSGTSSSNLALSKEWKHVFDLKTTKEGQEITTRYSFLYCNRISIEPG